MAIAYHSTVYLNHTYTLVVLGGLNVTNSSKNSGERQSLNPILIDTVTFQVTRKIITNNLNLLSGFPSFLVNINITYK